MHCDILPDHEHSNNNKSYDSYLVVQWCGVKSIMYESCMCLIYAICMYVFDSKCNSIPIYTTIYMYEWMNERCPLKIEYATLNKLN